MAGSGRGVGGGSTVNYQPNPNAPIGQFSDATGFTQSPNAAQGTGQAGGNSALNFLQANASPTQLPPNYVPMAGPGGDPQLGGLGKMEYTSFFQKTQGAPDPNLQANRANLLQAQGQNNFQNQAQINNFLNPQNQNQNQFTSGIVQEQQLAPAVMPPPPPDIARQNEQYNAMSAQTAQAQPNVFEAAAQGMGQAGITAGMETMYRPQTIAGTDLTQYTNPYETQVVQNTMSDLDRQRQIEANQLAAQATARGAFGGSRDALMQSELSRNYGQQMANTAAQLRQAGFQNAQQLAGQDIGYGLQGSQNRLNAASTLGQLSNLGFGAGMALNEQSWKQGALSQGINQMLIDAAKGQYGGYTGAPAGSLGMTTSAVGASPAPMSQTQTNSRNPGLFDYLTLAATAGS